MPYFEERKRSLVSIIGVAELGYDRGEGVIPAERFAIANQDNNSYYLDK
jgi:hypothetical protein